MLPGLCSFNLKENRETRGGKKAPLKNNTQRRPLRIVSSEAILFIFVLIFNYHIIGACWVVVLTHQNNVLWESPLKAVHKSYWKIQTCLFCLCCCTQFKWNHAPTRTGTYREQHNLWLWWQNVNLYYVFCLLLGFFLQYFYSVFRKQE